MANILLVEDDVHISNINKQALTLAGHNTWCAFSVKECIWHIEHYIPDLIIIDVGLPDGNGVDLCKEIKKQHDIPVIFLTAMSEKTDVIKGLLAGGDDYVTKPYDLDVLLARIVARLRKSGRTTTQRMIENVQLDSISCMAQCEGQDLLLTKREFLVLWLLAMRQGEVVPREEIYRSVWGSSAMEDFNALRTLVSRIKGKLVKVGAQVSIVTKRQEGYMLTVVE